MAAGRTNQEIQDRRSDLLQVKLQLFHLSGISLVRGVISEDAEHEGKTLDVREAGVRSSEIVDVGTR